MEQQKSAVDLALAMHETFLGSGSEDGLSPRLQNLDIRATVSPRARQLDTKASPIPDMDESEAGILDEIYLKNLSATEFDHHEKGAARLNNGSFGSCPKSVLLRQEKWVQEYLKQPDTFVYGPLQQALLESRRVVASHVHCRPEEVILMDNVTVAASAVALDVMWSFLDGKYHKGDLILLSNFTYGAVRKAFEAYAVRGGADILNAQIPFPVSSAEQVLASFEEALRGARTAGRVIRLAVIDHVVSMPSMIVPIKEMVALCRRYGVEQIFVDGAQAIGNLDINVDDIDADYYTGNLHKWCFAPSTVAFVHYKSDHHFRIHHPIVSHSYGKGLVAECEWIGTRDYSAMLAVPAAFDFIEKIPGGLGAVQLHNHKKVVAVGKMLAEAWGTHCGVSPELCASMVMVGLPPGLHIQNPEDCSALRTRLREEFSIEVHTYTPLAKEVSNTEIEPVTAYLRISHQIYNRWDEYLRLRDVISALVVDKTKR